MNDEKKDTPAEVFWYRFTIERIQPKDFGEKRFQLEIRLTPADMFAIAKGITNAAIPEEIPDSLTN